MCLRVCVYVSAGVCVCVCGVRARVFVCYYHPLRVSALTKGVHVGTGTLIDEKYQ